MSAPWLIDQDVRLAALASYDILDTPAETAFDAIVLNASRVCGTPVALISLVADGRQWFKARVGFGECQTPLTESVCAYVLQEADVLVIPDLTLDPRTRENTLVRQSPNIRFYAGARLSAADGTALGSLCVIDTIARPGGLTPGQAASLRELAQETMSLLELRRSAKGTR